MWHISATSKTTGYGEDMLSCQRTPATEKCTGLWKACAKLWWPRDGTCHDSIGIGPASWKWDDLNMKLHYNDCSQWHKFNKPSSGHGWWPLQGWWDLWSAKSPSAAQSGWSARSSLQKAALASPLAGPRSVLDVIPNFWSEGLLVRSGQIFPERIGDWLWIVCA